MGLCRGASAQEAACLPKDHSLKHGTDQAPPHRDGRLGSHGPLHPTIREDGPVRFVPREPDRLWRDVPRRPHLPVEYQGSRWWVAERDAAEDVTPGVLSLTNQL
jgi:hypothetical protein